MNFIVRWRPDGTRIFVNKSYCEYFGVTNEELMNTNVFKTLNKDVAEDIRPARVNSKMLAVILMTA